MGQLVGLAEIAQYLGVVSQGKRPGNRVWELLRAGKLRGLPYVRVGRAYRFDLAQVETWVKRQTAQGGGGLR
jgi:excisionase family DNA binding protein